VPQFLSQEWLDLQTKYAQELPDRSGVSARLQYKITGAPGGEVTFHTVIVDGRIAENALGEDANTEFAMTLPYKEFVRVTKGEVDASALFMQGKLKVVGSTRTLMTLMPMTESAEYREFLARVSAETQY
jgi:putative sterol carrier protein